MSKKEDFVDWFNEQKFRNFKSHEFTNYFDRNLNTYPPKSKWKNIVPTLRVLDDLRDEIRMPIRITSSYRSNKYNDNCGGAPKSLHKEFKALDFQVTGANPSWLFSKLDRMRRQGEFEGGLGLYSTFVHVDTRGSNATW